MELPVNYLPQHPFDNGELKIRDEVLLPFPRTEEMIRKDLADYYGMISEVDVQIGRIIQTLREKDELENTILIFASDNGLAVGRHGLLGKQNLYEHSISVPLVMVVPGMKKGGYLSDGLRLIADSAGSIGNRSFSFTCLAESGTETSGSVVPGL